MASMADFHSAGIGSNPFNRTMIIHYLNLTNGIEAYPSVPNPRFIRIQSSLGEAKAWSKILQELDYDFLMNVALGHKIFIHDFSSRKSQPRALYQCVPWIRFVLQAEWEDYLDIEVKVKNTRVFEYFLSCYQSLSLNKSKINYIKKFYKGPIDITCVGYQTKCKEDINYYLSILGICQI